MSSQESVTPQDVPGCTLEPIKAAEPIAPWFGGKKYLAKHIAARIEAVPHACYAEAFAGMGGVFLRRGSRPKTEILNDINGEIINLFRCLRDHGPELARQFDWALSSRAEFARLIKTPPESLTDIRRAARFAYIQRLSFSGKPAHLATPGQTKAITQRSSALSADNMKRLVVAAHDRLQRVHIECLDWRDFISRYDRPFTLFYLDPPYHGHEADYGKGVFARDDFAEMADRLKTIKGRFILSINDTKEIRRIFAWADMEVVHTRYSANARATRRVAELMIVGGGT